MAKWLSGRNLKASVLLTEEPEVSDSGDPAALNLSQSIVFRVFLKAVTTTQSMLCYH